MSELTERKRKKMQIHDTWKWIRLAFCVWEFWALNRNYTVKIKKKIHHNMLYIQAFDADRLWCNTLLCSLWRDEKNIVLLVCLWWWICNAKGIYGNEISVFDWRRMYARFFFIELHNLCSNITSIHLPMGKKI